MKITKVEAFLMSHGFPDPIRLPFWGGERTILKRDAMLIKVSTDKGLNGYAPGPAHQKAKEHIDRLIAPFLAGQDPEAWASLRFKGDAETMKTYRSVEIALLDIAGKAQGLPISEVIGGRKRDAIKLYGSAGMYMAPQGYADEAAAIAGLGFTAYKMRPALGPEKDLETLAKMRAAVGLDVGLMIDAHAWWRMGDKSYSYDTVRDLARSMAEYQPAWLEEPLPPDDHPAYQRLKEDVPEIILASGEHEPSEESFADLIEGGGINYAQMDVCCQGGFELGQRIFKRVQDRGLKFAFHSWGTSLEVLAAAHLGICWPESVVEWLEYPCYSHNGKPGMYPFPLADAILSEPLDIQNGHLIVPSTPGLGIEVDESVIENFPFHPGPWSYFYTESPPETVAVTGDHSVKWVGGPDLEPNS